MGNTISCCTNKREDPDETDNLSSRGKNRKTKNDLTTKTKIKTLQKESLPSYLNNNRNKARIEESNSNIDEHIVKRDNCLIKDSILEKPRVIRENKKPAEKEELIQSTTDKEKITSNFIYDSDSRKLINNNYEIQTNNDNINKEKEMIIENTIKRDEINKNNELPPESKLENHPIDNKKNSNQLENNQNQTEKLEKKREILYLLEKSIIEEKNEESIFSENQYISNSCNLGDSTIQDIKPIEEENTSINPLKNKNFREEVKKDLKLSKVVINESKTKDYIKDICSNNSLRDEPESLSTNIDIKGESPENLNSDTIHSITIENDYKVQSSNFNSNSQNQENLKIKQSKSINIIDQNYLNHYIKPQEKEQLNQDNKPQEKDLLNHDSNSQEKDLLNHDINSQEKDLLNQDSNYQEKEQLNKESNAQEKDLLNQNSNLQEKEHLNQDNNSQEKEQLNQDNKPQEKEQLNQYSNSQEKEQLNQDNKPHSKELLNQDNKPQEKDLLNQDSNSQEKELLNQYSYPQKKEQLNQDNKSQQKEQLNQDNKPQHLEQLNQDNKPQQKELINQDSKPQQKELLNQDKNILTVNDFSLGKENVNSDNLQLSFNKVSKNTLDVQTKNNKEEDSIQKKKTILKNINKNIDIDLKVVKNEKSRNKNEDYDEFLKKTIYIDDKAKRMMQKRKTLFESSDNIYQNLVTDDKTGSSSNTVVSDKREKSYSINKDLFFKSNFNNDSNLNVDDQKRHTVSTNPMKKLSLNETNTIVRRKSSIMKSNQNSLIMASLKQERKSDLNKFKIELSIKLKENKLEEDLSMTVFSEDKILAQIKNKRGNIITFDQNFIFEYSMHLNQSIKLHINTNNAKFEHITNLGKILTNQKNQQTIKDSKFDLLFEASLVSIKEMKIYSVFSVKYSLKLLTMTSKNIMFKMLMYENQNKEGERLYESEEKTGQKIFQFCDAMIINDLISRKNCVFIIEIYEKEKLIGKTKSVDLKQLKESSKGLQIYDSNSKEITSSKLEISYSERKAENFIDHLSKGLELENFMAIDFTSSNLECNNNDSLHFINKLGYNEYEKIFVKFFKILENYDKKQVYTVYGFGAIPPEKDEVNHCFCLNFKNEPEIEGLPSLIENYRAITQKIKFLGPTYLKFVVKKMIEKVKKSVVNNKRYYISLILVDGLVNDLEETIDLFVEASKLPISFIIAGVGNGEFGNMEILDRKKYSLYNTLGEKALRDAVQFVKFEDSIDFDVFAQICIKDIPDQIEEFFRFQTVLNNK